MLLVALTALNDILSSSKCFPLYYLNIISNLHLDDPPSSAAAAPAASPVTIDEEPVLVTASDITDTASAAAADASVVGDSTSAEKWYAVIVGREPGVHCGASVYSPIYFSYLYSFIFSATVTSNVQRISGSQVVKCASQAQAQQLFDAALEAGQVEKVASIVTRTKMTQADFA